MKSLMQNALGNDWEKLSPALQNHYRNDSTIEHGYLNIEYPRFMQPLLHVLRCLGALVNREGHELPTVVARKKMEHRQRWQRTITFPDGKTIRFDSVWELSPENHLVEFVNSILALKMAVHVEGDTLHYAGVNYVVKLGPLQIALPEWLVLGHTTIREKAVDDAHIEMDFRLTHPLFGQVYRYSGIFNTAGSD